MLPALGATAEQNNKSVATQDGGYDFRGRLRVKAFEPDPVRIAAIRANISFDPNIQFTMVT